MGDHVYPEMEQKTIPVDQIPKLHTSAHVRSAQSVVCMQRHEIGSNELALIIATVTVAIQLWLIM